MGSPNEPGQPRAGERSANGDVTTDVPPWQNSARPRPEATQRTASIPATRWVTGTAAPSVPAPASAVQRTDVVNLVEPIPSELPDLSGPVPRPPQQRQAVAEPPLPPLPAAPPGPPVSAGQPTVPTMRTDPTGRPRGPVRASMQVRRIDPWSALKVSLLLNVALFFVWMIAVAFLYLVLGAMGVWSKLNSNVGDLLTTGSGGGGADLVSAASIFGGAALIGLVNIVLLTAMATVGAYIYNLSTDIVGGVEVTLADLD